MNRSLLCVLLLGIFFYPRTRLYGQDYPMINYTVENGLPSNNVYCVYRDSKGFIWIGTDKGVARCNGVKFEVFSTFNGLPDNEIFFFQEDRYGRVWLGTFNGELCYYEDGVFHSSENTPFLRLPVKVTHTKRISVERDSSLIVSFYEAGIFIAIKNDRCKIISLDSLHDPVLLNPNTPPYIAFRKKISDNRFKLICSDKIIIVDTFGKAIETQKVDPKFFNPHGKFAACQNQEYMFNSNYVFNTDMQPVRTIRTNVLEDDIQEIYIGDGNAFYATRKGLFINDTISILKQNNVSSVTQDDQGNYWISTLDNGVYTLSKGFLKSKLYKNAYETTAKYAHALNGHVFFVTAANNLFDLNKGKINCLHNYKNYVKQKELSLEFGFLIDSNYRYFNTFNRDFTVLDNVFSGKAKIYAGLGEAVKELFSTGEYIYTKQHHTINRVQYSKTQRALNIRVIGKSAHYERIFGMAKAPDNSIWYSTINSMYKIEDNDSDGIPQPQFKNTDFKYFDFFGPYLIGYTQNNRLLICSNYTNANIKIDSVTLRNCIWDKLYKIDRNHVLISTNNLYRLLTLDTGNVPFPVYSIENSYIPLHAEAICYDGEFCYFFKDHSITVINKSSILEKPEPPKIFFTSLKAGSKPYPIRDEVQIPFSESKHMSVIFTTMSFSARDIQYQYSVSKNDTDNWSDAAGEEINLVYSGYGTYFIKVRAKSISSDYCDPIVFKLEVLRPFWATWWFFTLVAIAVVMITGVLLRYRLLYILRKKEKEHDTEIKFMRSEYKALNALMNPHFIFNTLNNVQGLVNRNDKLAANEYIRVFADLIRQNMHNISKELIPLQKEIDLVSNYLLIEKLRFKDLLNYEVKIQEGLDLSEIMVPPLLVQPLVENSIKHGILPRDSKEGLIHINVYEREDNLIIEVKDNGVGMGATKKEDASLHESFGLQNVKKRIEQLGIMQNKKISFHISEARDDAGKLKWTIVTITIPISE